MNKPGLYNSPFSCSYQKRPFEILFFKLTNIVINASKSVNTLF